MLFRSGKSDAQIVNEQEASLNAKSSQYSSEQFDSKQTDGSYESGGARGLRSIAEIAVNESNLDEFSAPRGVPQTTYGRTGQTGGGENDQQIPPEEGGYDGTNGAGGRSNTYEGSAGDKYDQRDAMAKGMGTGSVSLRGDDPGARSVNDEIIGDLRGDNKRQPDLIDQSSNPYDPNAQ